jgi:hypothetical protein
MGDLSSATDPVSALIAQINRFTGAAAPISYRVADVPYPVASGNLALVAPVAVVLYQRAATDSFNQFGDAGSAAQIAKANQGFADPSGFVGKNMAEVTALITALASSLSLPSADGALGNDASRMIFIVGAALLATWLLSR